MFPKFKIQSGLIKITGECINVFPYEFGVQWDSQKSKTIGKGNNYKFVVDVNGEKGELFISDRVLQKLEETDFQELLLSDLNLNTTVTDFNIVLQDTYRDWLR